MGKKYENSKSGYEIRKIAFKLKKMGLEKGSHVAILSKNCAHWMMADLAIMMAGHTSVPLYPNLNAETLQNILEHSETKVLFVGKLDNYSDMKSGVPSSVKCITYPFYSQDYPKWNELLMDINPRLGGGVLASIEAGFDITKIMLQDIKNLKIRNKIHYKELIMDRFMTEVFYEINN